MTAADDGWRRLSPRMLLVHPVHEVLRQVPVLIGSVVLGSATGSTGWPLAALALTVGVGLGRWFTTAYRIDDDTVTLRSGLVQRRVVAVPRNRIRSVTTDARPLHRLLGLAVLSVSTGQEAAGDARFELDAVEAAATPRLRALLLADDVPEAAAPVGEVLAQWTPGWLRYSPLSLSGLATVGAAVGLALQAGLGPALRDSAIADTGAAAAQRFGPAAVATAAAVALLLVSTALAVLTSLLRYGNLLLRRDPGDRLYLRHGLLRVREHSFDMRRLRGGTLREPLVVRAVGGARLDAVMTGVGGEGESSLLLPPCPAGTARGVLGALIDSDEAASGPLQSHGPAAARRRVTRALALPVAAGVALGVASGWLAVPGWAWAAVAVAVVAAALLAVDRIRALGHRVDTGWLVTRAGSVERRRDCLATAGVIGWTVRQTWWQRRAGVATLAAATAAGRKRYTVLDVPAEQAWAVAAAASPWVARSRWARP
ncbi:PH domain-containing protein [Mycobacterium sp. MYCO198283]|uniref:PH domain-containing protein n=1 Tax=Mycobacterium sp. MYCO198283 TaxID=2883505 RepID=UPI001E528796|nr:PH domain-containing protein [Mycobacterium sp. MYCO198283]MCG5432239.1 PH domain-containing protein [Mycobacterium sp. MYCO198283]